MFQRIRINGYFRQLGSPEIFLREFFFNNPTLEKQKRNNRHVKFEATEKRSLVSRNHTILEALETKGSTIPWRELLWNLWTSTSIPVHQELPIEMKTEEQVETPSISSQQERETRVNCDDWQRATTETRGLLDKVRAPRVRSTEEKWSEEGQERQLTCGKLRWRQEELWVHHPLTGSLCL